MQLWEITPNIASKIIATTDVNQSVKFPEMFLLPSTLIRKPKTDEELAEEKYPLLEVIDNDGLDEIFINQNAMTNSYQYAKREGFLAGLKARGGKFHLTGEDLVNIIKKARELQTESLYKYETYQLISSLTPPIYPHTITVDYEDGKYYWETLKEEY